MLACPHCGAAVVLALAAGAAPRRAPTATQGWSVNRPSGWWGDFVDDVRWIPPASGECELRVDHEARSIALRTPMDNTGQFGLPVSYESDGWHSVTDAAGQTMELLLDVSDAESNAILTIRPPARRELIAATPSPAGPARQE